MTQFFLRLRSALLTLRSGLFYLGYYLSLIVLSILVLSWCGLISYPKRAPLVFLWNRFVIFWLRLICGVRYKVYGRENLPTETYVALAKHQSPWETIFLQYCLGSASTVLKRELLRIPLFGWGLRLANPIAIDRSNPKAALKQTQTVGLERLAQGIDLLIFPEGTRTPVGKKGKYARGGANIAVAAGAPVVPIAHNAGTCWPAHQLIKNPGTITVVIGEPIDTRGKTSREVTDQVAEWIEAEVEKITSAPAT